MILLQALGRENGPAGACLALVQANAIDLLLSQDVLDEWRDVLARPEVQRTFPGIVSEQMERLLSGITQVARMTAPRSAPVLVDRDPKDQKYLDLAFAGNASFLVTRDRDLLALASHPQWVQTIPTLQILDPVAFLRAIATLASGQ